MVKKIFSVFPKSALVTNHPSWHWEEVQVSPNVYIDVVVDNRCDSSTPALE